MHARTHAFPIAKTYTHRRDVSPARANERARAARDATNQSPIARARSTTSNARVHHVRALRQSRPVHRRRRRRRPSSRSVARRAAVARDLV